MRLRIGLDVGGTFTDLAGVDLDTEAKDRFKAIMQELAEAQAEFEHNVQDASDAWSLHITDDENLRGLPEPLLARAAEDAKHESAREGHDVKNYDVLEKEGVGDVI